MKQISSIFLCTFLAACGGGGNDVALSGMVAEKKGSVRGPGACGVRNAYSVSQAGGVQLTQPAMLTRDAANTLNAWLETRAAPAIGRRGGGLAAIQVASHYACRTRNSKPGARLSEHARGRAIDISAFILADGTRITIEDGWNGSDGTLLRKLHASACGPFGTVLGPESDRFHKDHFHLDIADYRSGAYCR